jgi:hypothetical protein
MTATKKREDSNNETVFALLMIALSVIIFLAIRNSEKSDSDSQ